MVEDESKRISVMVSETIRRSAVVASIGIGVRQLSSSSEWLKEKKKAVVEYGGEDKCVGDGERRQGKIN